MLDRGHPPTPYVEAAVSYVERGWTVVFPLDKSGDFRGPKANGGPGSWKETTATTSQEVRRIYREEDVHPKVVAVLVGPESGMMALDWDGPDGLKTRAQWEEDHGPLPPTLSSRTGSGGRHDLFSYRPVTGRANANAQDEGFDFKEGTGGASFIYAPPTDRTALKESHTEPYAWKDADAAVANLPDAWVKALQEDGEEERTERFRLPERIPDGARNETLYRYGCQLREQGANREIILERLLEVNEERCDPPIPPGEVEGRAASAAKHARGRAIGRIQKVRSTPMSYRVAFAGQWVEVPDTASLLDRNQVRELAAEQVGLIPTPSLSWDAWTTLVGDRLAEAEEIIPEGVETEPPRVYTLDELGDEAKDVEKVTPHLAYRNLVNLLYGPGKESGKSTLIATDLLLAAQAGLRVVWLSEMPRDVARNYLRRVQVQGPIPGDQIGVVGLKENPPRSWQGVEDLILGFGAQVLYVDTLVAAVGAFQGETPDHADNSAWHSFFQRWFGRWATIGDGQAVVVAHHTRKDDSKLIGSVGVRDGTDFLTQMEPATPDQNVRKLTTIGRMPPEEDRERYVRFNEGTNLYEPADFSPGSEEGLNAPPGDHLETSVLAFVRDHPGAKARDLRDGVRGAQDVVLSTRDELLELGLLENRGNGRGHAYHLAKPFEECLEFLEQEHQEIVRPQESGSPF